MKINLNIDEKKEILSIIGLWTREQITFEKFRNIQKLSGVPARMIETVFWLEDTLDILSEYEHLILKGGTCVQCHIPHFNQRASVDIDFNTDIENPHAIISYIEKINEQIRANKRCCIVNDIEFGIFEFDFDDKVSGIINFKRRMPSRFGEFELYKDRQIMSKSIRLQINYKNSWFPAQKTVKKKADFFINHFEKPKRDVNIIMESPGDLFADKLLAVCNIGGFGRERFKDVYDLAIMKKYHLSGIEKEIISKLSEISKKSRIYVKEIIDGAAQTVESFSNRFEEAKGFSSMVCKDGKVIIKNWEFLCEELAESISGLNEVC